MIAALLLPNLPSLAISAAMDNCRAIVHERGLVVSPLPLKGMPAERARAMFPNAVVAARHHALEDMAWEGAIDEVFNFTPLLEATRSDTKRHEATRSQRILCSPDDMEALRRVVERVEAQCGLAETGGMATLAAMSARPGGIVTVHADAEQRFLAGTSSDVLVDEDDVAERLELLGLTTIGSLMHLTEKQLGAQFGDTGRMIYDFLSHLSTPTTLSMYTPPPDVIIQERFTDSTNEPGTWHLALGTCIQAAGFKLQALSFKHKALGIMKCQRIEVALLDASDVPFKKDTRILRSPTNDAQLLHTQACTMVTNMCSRSTYAWGVQLRLASLSQPRAIQASLFAEATSGDSTRSDMRLHEATLKISKKVERHFVTINVIDPNAYCPDHFARFTPRTSGDKLQALSFKL